MRRRDELDPAVFEAWASGEIRNKNARKPLPDHGDGERGFNALGVIIAIVIGFALINVPTLFTLLAPYLKG